MMGTLAEKSAGTAGAEGLVSCLDGGLFDQAQKCAQESGCGDGNVILRAIAASRGLSTFDPAGKQSKHSKAAAG